METDATRYREAIERHGFSRTHHQIVQWIPRGARVLELGCASGYHGEAFIKERGCTVVGVELDENAAREARTRGLDVRVGSLEDPRFRSSIAEQFDVVTAADVLEHLADPASVLGHMRRWLAPGGRAIIAVPNIATWRMRKQIFFRGDFEYQETGILDRTHLRFFTWRSLNGLVAEHGFTIVDTMFEIDNAAWNSPLAKLIPGVVRERVMQRIVDARPNLYAEHIALRLAP
jgi:methionine biosynthesis protein MetW